MIISHVLRLLKDYIESKEQELADYNKGLATEVDSEVNRRRLTNAGTLRAYAYNYLKNHPKIHKGMTLIVRQLGPGPEGLPLGDLLLHKHDRMGRLRRHPVGYLRSLAGNRAGIRVASISETGRFGFGKPQIVRSGCIHPRGGNALREFAVIRSRIVEFLIQLHFEAKSDRIAIAHVGDGQSPNSNTVASLTI